MFSLISVHNFLLSCPSKVSECPRDWGPAFNQYCGETPQRRVMQPIYGHTSRHKRESNTRGQISDILLTNFGQIELNGQHSDSIIQGMDISTASWTNRALTMDKKTFREAVSTTSWFLRFGYTTEDLKRLKEGGT